MHPQMEHLRKLSITQKLQVLEELWDDLAASGEFAPPIHVVEEASRRAAEIHANPSIAITEDELWRRVDRATEKS